MLSCSHSFCSICLQTWWASTLSQKCPLCERRSSKSDPTRNLVLKNLCEAFSQQLPGQGETAAASGDLCSLHSEKLKLFCLDDQKPVCLICRESKTHGNHKFRPLDEAAEDYKKELLGFLKPLQEKLEHFKQVKGNWDQTAAYVNVQALYTQIQIEEQFKKLYKFLQEEEKARIKALKAEEEEKSQILMDKIDDLSRDIAAISGSVSAIENELATGSVSFLQNYKGTLERVEQHLMLTKPQLSPGALINTAKHLGNLTFNIWDKMAKMVTYSPVILDPNTAHSSLFLSKCLTSARRMDKERAREPPKTPDRFENYLMVLGSECFNSGTRSWDVEVQYNVDWAVGVIEESASRTGQVLAGYWELSFRDGKCKVFSPLNTDHVLALKSLPQRIRVHLDMNRAKLSFSNADANTNLYTFNQTFTKRLFPFLSTASILPLKITPMKVAAKLEI